jgi:hypothetical protein
MNARALLTLPSAALACAALLVDVHPLVGAASGPLTTPASLPSPARLPPCQRAFLDQSPSWSAGAAAAWTPTNELVVMDQMYKRALRYSARGESLGTLPDTVEPALELSFPREVKSSEDGLIFRLVDNRLKILGRDYQTIREVSEVSSSHSAPLTLQTKSGNTSGRVVALWLWQPVGKDIVSFSDIALPPHLSGDNGQRVGFVRFSTSPPQQIRVLGKPGFLPASSSLRLYNRLGHEYIAAIGESAFILRMDDLTIYRQTPPSLDLKPLPNDWRKIALPDVTGPPKLPEFTSPKQVAEVLAAVENSSMPVGLYSWAGDLFVLTRSFVQGATEWRITRINPSSGHVTGTATVPVNAHHLTVVPGPRRWAFLEKGAVTGWNDNQEIPSIYFVPSIRFSHALAGNICAE